MSDRRSMAFAGLTLVWLLGLELLGVEAAIAYLAPALLIMLPLLSGRYPGDEALVRVAGRRSRPSRRPTQEPPLRRRRQPERTDRDEQGATMKSITGRVAAASGVLTLALAGTAGAHITANPAEGPSDGFATVSFQVPHGCEESPTTQLRIQIPPSVPSATPSVHPLWDVSTKEGKKDKVELHGETITRGVSEVTYTAKQPLPCEKGETRWIQIPAEGENPDELEDPAPAVVLTAAEGGPGAAASSEEDAAAGQGSAQPAASVQTASVASDDDGAPMWLAITALGVGALGLLAGVGGLTAGRRRSA